MTDPSDALPEAAKRRLTEGAFTSGLSVADFAACLSMGLQPVGLVQGFCAMQSSSYANSVYLSRGLSPFVGAPSGYVENYQCPHGMVSGEHRMWGQNYQQTWVEDAWHLGFTNAYSRMLEEAETLGADGVIGVIDTEQPLTEAGIIEFHIRGTAVKVQGESSTASSPWTTYLAGQRLAKVFEAGYAPVSVVAAVSSVRVWAYCMTEYLMGTGGLSMWSTQTSPVEIDQIVNARTAAREMVRANARTQLRGDALHGVELQLREREFEKGDLEVNSVLRGNRLRRFKDFARLPVPRPMVRLS
jgi:uncharacterized protein YbjQ (UPF0145 family)